MSSLRSDQRNLEANNALAAGEAPPRLELPEHLPLNLNYQLKTPSIAEIERVAFLRDEYLNGRDQSRRDEIQELFTKHETLLWSAPLLPAYAAALTKACKLSADPTASHAHLLPKFENSAAGSAGQLGIEHSFQILALLLDWCSFNQARLEHQEIRASTWNWVRQSLPPFFVDEGGSQDLACALPYAVGQKLCHSQDAVRQAFSEAVLGADAEQRRALESFALAYTSVARGDFEHRAHFALAQGGLGDEQEHGMCLPILLHAEFSRIEDSAAENSFSKRFEQQLQIAYSYKHCGKSSHPYSLRASGWGPESQAASAPRLRADLQDFIYPGRVELASHALSVHYVQLQEALQCNVLCAEVAERAWSDLMSRLELGASGT